MRIPLGCVKKSRQASTLLVLNTRPIPHPQHAATVLRDSQAAICLRPERTNHIALSIDRARCMKLIRVLMGQAAQTRSLIVSETSNLYQNVGAKTTWDNAEGKTQSTVAIDGPEALQPRLMTKSCEPAFEWFGHKKSPLTRALLVLAVNAIH